MLNVIAGQRLLASQLIEIQVEEKKTAAELIKRTITPYEVGLIKDGDFPFQIEIEGENLLVKSLAALLANGHLVKYKNTRDHGTFLKTPLTGLPGGEYYAHLIFEGEYVSAISTQAFGKTEVPDIRVPSYRIDLKSAIMSPQEFPHTLPLAKITLFDGGKARPELDGNFCPLLSQIGSHPLGISLLASSKAYHHELSEASQRLYFQVRSVPDENIFTDIKQLAAALDTYLMNWNVSVQHWTDKNTFFQVFRYWSGMAQVFKKYTQNTRWARRQDDTLRMIYEAGNRGGQFEVERFFVPTIGTLSDHQLSHLDVNITIDLLEKMIHYVAFSWVRLGMNKGLRIHEEVSFTNRI